MGQLPTYGTYVRPAHACTVKHSTLGSPTYISTCMRQRSRRRKRLVSRSRRLGRCLVSGPSLTAASRDREPQLHCSFGTCKSSLACHLVVPAGPRSTASRRGECLVDEMQGICGKAQISRLGHRRRCMHVALAGVRREWEESGKWRLVWSGRESESKSRRVRECRVRV